MYVYATPGFDRLNGASCAAHELNCLPTATGGPKYHGGLWVHQRRVRLTRVRARLTKVEGEGGIRVGLTRVGLARVGSKFTPQGGYIVICNYYS